MPIAFEGVSYSYADPARQEKRKSRVKRRREAGVIENPPSLEHGKPAWGADPDAVWALRDITFALDDGEFLGIAGHTGSGKSTLIQHMNGLVHPTRGRVLLDGQDLADKRAAQACRGKVGLVFQYPEYQLFAATVREDVAFGPRNLGLPADEVDRRVEAALESVRLDIVELGDKSPFELSGGQQRRVAFAGVLAMEPRILVLDEPVAGLDPVAREEFLDLIAQLHAGGLTVVMVSHSMDDLARLSDRARRRAARHRPGRPRPPKAGLRTARGRREPAPKAVQHASPRNRPRSRLQSPSGDGRRQGRFRSERRSEGCAASERSRSGRNRPPRRWAFGASSCLTSPSSDATGRARARCTAWTRARSCCWRSR